MKRLALVLSALALLSLTGCPPRARGAGGGGGGGGGGSLASCAGDFGATHAAAKIEAFLSAVIAWNDAAMGMQRDLLRACQSTGRTLGMPEAELSGEGTDGMRTVCGAVQARLRAEIAAVRDSAGGSITLDARPPSCEVSVDAYANCMAECEATVDPGSVEITCEGGELRGYCDAECHGSCAVHVEARCSGTCEGECDGTCSARNASGACAGTCDGTCNGHCVTRGTASCAGECRGGCSITYREPYCTGRVRRPTASARCRASCDARVEASARCTPGETHINVTAGLDADGQARLARLQAALRDGVSDILTIRTRVERLRDAGAEIVRLAPEIPNSAAAVGLNAALCATAAAGAVANASASISVSVEVSVSMSASVSGSASAR